MGCAASKVDNEERVQICRERKRLMKEVLLYRGEFADALLAYLRSLKNTGVTLRQFTESESLEIDDTPDGAVSPPPPLPPSPPPPPPFSPEIGKIDDHDKEDSEDESTEISEDDDFMLPPPPLPANWNFWDPFEAISPSRGKQGEMADHPDEEDWEETKTDFGEEDCADEIVENSTLKSLPEKIQPTEMDDDNLSTVSTNTKDTVDVAIAMWRAKKTLGGIVKDLDEYFLKASALGKEIAILVDVNSQDTFSSPNLSENKRKRSNSAKVFSALSWSWSSKSLQLAREASESIGPNEPCGAGAHLITLEKLYAAEQRLLKDIKEEENAKSEYERKSMLLLRHEEENYDYARTEKTRLTVASLHSDIEFLQQSISRTCSDILTIIDDELYPQLVTLITGMMHIWKTMYKSHQVQSHISQHLGLISFSQIANLTSDYHFRAGLQLEAEVAFWHISFCKLIKFQREYVRALSGWIQRTDCLVDERQQSAFASAIRIICREWQSHLDRVSEKDPLDAISSLLSAIKSIVSKQAEVQSQQKKYDKLQNKLQKELELLDEMEKGPNSSLKAEKGPRDPLHLKRTKIEELKTRVDDERAHYLSLVQDTKTMALTSLKRGLPNVFKALMEYSGACSKAFEAIQNRVDKGTLDEGDSSVLSA